MRTEKEILELIKELDSLKESKNIDFVDKRRREIRATLLNYNKNENWCPNEKQLEDIKENIIFLRDKCKPKFPKRAHKEESHLSRKIEKKVNVDKNETLKDRAICECGDTFDIRRKKAGYNTCINCGEIEAQISRPTLNEGLPGTREENKKMRGQVWGEIRNRSKDN